VNRVFDLRLNSEIFVSSQIPGITDFIERTEDLVRSGILIVDADGKILKNMIVFH
jgi:hypothetical protein